MKRMEVKAVKTNKDNIIVFISKKKMKPQKTEIQLLKKQVLEEKRINEELNEKLSRLKGENSVLKNTKEILEGEIERLRDFMTEDT